MYDKFDRMTQRNVGCDTLSKTGFVSLHHANKPQPDILPRELITVYVGGEITGGIGKGLCNERSRLIMKNLSDKTSYLLHCLISYIGIL